MSEPTSADARAAGSIGPRGPIHAISPVATTNPMTAPTTHGRIDSSTALTPMDPGPHPRTANTPASTRRAVNENMPAAATTPNEMKRPARNSTWIGPCTAAIRWSTTFTARDIALRSSNCAPCPVPAYS